MIPVACFIDLYGKDLSFNEDIKRKIEEKCKGTDDYKKSHFRALISDFTKDGVKKFLMKASGKAVKLVLSTLPFSQITLPTINLLTSIIKD